MDDLNAAKLEDVQAFFETYYAPNNATLVVVGDFRPAELRRLVNDYFAEVPRHATPPRVTCDWKVGPGERRRDVEDAHANLPAVVRYYRVPADDAPAPPALDLLTRILGEGESSRLNVGVVRHDQAALQAATFIVNERRGPGVLIAYGVANQQVDVRRLDSLLVRQLDSVRAGGGDGGGAGARQGHVPGDLHPPRRVHLRQGGSPQSLRSAPRGTVCGEHRPRPLPRGHGGRHPAGRRQIPRSGQRGRAARAAQGRARELGRCAVKAVRRSGGQAVGTLLTSAIVLTAYPAIRLSAQGFPTRPPKPARLAPVRFPPFTETRLPNGLDLIVIEHHEQPVLSVSLSFRAGDAYDPAGKNGLAELVAELLSKGTGARTAEQIAATIEGVGGSLSASSNQDFLTVSVDALSDDAQLAFDLLGDVTLHSTFPASELDLARTRALSALALQLSEPASLADRFFAQELYGRHPYARHPTAESYKAVTRDDVVTFAAQRLRPAGSLVVVAGDVTAAQVQDLIAKTFGSWRGAAPEIGRAHV